ncbi:MAG: hypothetical protein ABIH03_00965 [Pseudomonadota bacterium]
MIPTSGDGWRALFTVDGGTLARVVAFWCEAGIPMGGVVEESGNPPAADFYGVVVDERGRLVPADYVDGFFGYCAPDDDPRSVLSAVAAGKAGAE